jgi:hypothetical protein
LAGCVSEWESARLVGSRCSANILILQKKLFAPVGERCAGDSAESFMIRRKIWLHYHAIRLSVEILAIFGTAALIGYWIVQTSR